jgi:DNA mismatch repair ATPase MutS
LAEFLANRKYQAGRLEFHLKNIPFVNPESPVTPGLSDLFLYKKFLSNAKAVFAILPPAVKKQLGIKWRSQELLNLLSGGGEGDAFRIADSASLELSGIRGKLNDCVARINALRKEKIKELRARCGLDFSARDFIVMDETEARKFAKTPGLFMEGYDSANLVVKPVFGPAYLDLLAGKEKYHKKEKELETGIIKGLAAEINSRRRLIAAYVLNIEAVDVSVARARLALQFHLTRPALNRGFGPLILKKARFLPLELMSKDMGLKYTPLSAAFSKRVNIIHGANMGGKTVVLKTISFLQLLAQSGFFVPAEVFQTRIFEQALLIGGAEEKTGGLSGFGLEMNDFVAALRVLTDKTALVLMDEFARTTNSSEATALLSAVALDLAGRKNALTFIATHFSGLSSKANTDYLVMRGFDNAAFSKYFFQKTGAGLNAKLRMINKFMRYELIKGGKDCRIYDALKIAGILGVPGHIIKNARKLMGERS